MIDTDSPAGCADDVLGLFRRERELLGRANKRGETLLMAAAYHGRMDWVEFLLAEPAVIQTINQRDNEGVTALMHAAVAGHA